MDEKKWLHQNEPPGVDIEEALFNCHESIMRSSETPIFLEVVLLSFWDKSPASFYPGKLGIRKLEIGFLPRPPISSFLISQFPISHATLQRHHHH